MTLEEYDELKAEILQEAYEEEKHRIQLEEDPLDYILNKYADKLQEVYDLMTPIVDELFEAGLDIKDWQILKEYV